MRRPPHVRRSLRPASTWILSPPPKGRVRSWVKLLRTHQWAKNALVLVPLLTAHKFGFGSLVDAIGAFLAFSLAASAIYVVNDLVDLGADRKHPTKRKRPLATGSVPILAALPVAFGLLAIAFALALLITPLFVIVLLAYLASTTAYTFFLKRKMLVDIVALASLYTLRVIGGAAAISVPISEWLLGFSMFIFTSLALIKRYVELAGRLDAGLPDPSNRNYRKSDLDVVTALAAAAGFNAVTVFALYISSDAVQPLYRHPKVLWLACPILMYWLGRVLMMAHRRLMDDDPVSFALRDWNSLLAFALIGCIMIAASGALI
ncbi:UbiA family prenyltransferase [Rhodopseudomonas sp. G2_2311]|uniref:UbiA family prenyltransferase n=1 Tax=Rhodopseudomonas sp. G2_2311 TaxID=3114287 RepID=UPI0039C650EB